MPTKLRRSHCRSSGWALLMLLFGGAAAARAAPLKSVSMVQFRADVARLESLVADCEAATTACDPARVGDDERVADAGFAMHWRWLRDVLSQAKGSGANRTQQLQAAAAQLSEIAQESAANVQATPGFGRARAAANAVLAEPQFAAAEGPTWWDRLKAKLMSWLAEIFAGVGRLGSAAPWLGKLLEWLLFVGAAVGLLFFLLRNVARQRLRVALSAGATKPTAWDRESTDWERMAERHAAAGEWRDAMHCLYWAAIVLLESQRAWRHNPARTPREYVRLLGPGSVRQKALRALTQSFERVWYGLRDADAVQYSRARELYEQLARTTESSARSGEAAAGAA
jgi:hypothetical protein